MQEFQIFEEFRIRFFVCEQIKQAPYVDGPGSATQVRHAKRKMKFCSKKISLGPPTTRKMYILRVVGGHDALEALVGVKSF